MKLLYWNVRGFGNPESQVALKNYCSTHKPDIIFLAEPMVSFDQISNGYWRSLKLDKFGVNRRESRLPNLWSLWHSSFHTTILVFVSDQCMVLEISLTVKVYVAAIYANTSYLRRRQLWADLTRLQSQFIAPWLFLGDFNAVLGAHEKRGSRLPPKISCDDFLLWTGANQLSHLHTIGVHHTWANGRSGNDFVALLLDRAICNHAWLLHWNSVHCCALFKVCSDHHPIVVSQDSSGVSHALPFRFFKAWTTHEDCARVVREVWSKEVYGAPMFCLQQKLKRLKAELRKWNKQVFGNIDSNVKLAIDEVSRIQNLIDQSGPTDDLQYSDYQAQLILTKALLTQDLFWKEKSRVQQFLHGDRNTSYFHRLAKIKSSTKHIHLLNSGSGPISNPEVLEQHIVDYFKGIFCGVSTCLSNDMIQSCIPSVVSDADNASLTRLPSSQDVKLAVFEMNGDGAPGPDGYSGHFYQTFWEIIHRDVVASVQSFFLTGKLLPNLNSILLILIPKTPGADTIENFRPIALANFQFKIITKILADRLSQIAPTIISSHQRGFIPGRNISDCVIVTSEAINVLSKKCFAGNIAMKIDIKKAFDSLNWDFLLAVLKKFGFDSIFCSWISEILLSARLSILVNGKSVGYFSCDRGVRQGDPLSPLLFCIAEEVLSRGLMQALEDGRLQPMTLCRGINIPSHVLYADDIMIFCKASKRNIKVVLDIFTKYGQASGQLINNQKSKFYAGSIPNSRLITISNLLGFNSGALPFTYLGCPIFVGKPKKIHFQPIADKIKTKLAT
jgi:hypothetical protein